jgi:hypothetical protein
MAKTKTSEKEPRRYFRSHLPTIVWNPDEGRPLADFSEGHFTTDDPKVQKKLEDLGYLEIPLDATEPPTGVIIRQPTHIIEGEIPLLRPGQGEKFMEKRMDSLTKEVGKPESSTTAQPAEKPKTTAKTTKTAPPKKAPAKKAAKPQTKKSPKSKSSAIRRRKAS